MLRGNMHFKKRTRQPPTDPVNSLLGFAYTLLYNEAISAAVAAGFDPYLGFYHSVRYGRCSLALDLMEEMRPPDRRPPGPESLQPRDSQARGFYDEGW
jgi:CRISPR-associated protein Cas1